MALNCSVSAVLPRLRNDFAINSFNASVCGAYVFLQTKFLTVTRNARKFRPEALIRAVMTPKNFACSAIRRRKFAKKGG